MKYWLWFRSITRWLFLLGLCLIVVGLLFSKVFISVGSFTILGTWLIDWDMRNKLTSFFRNKLALGISLLFLVHILGLTYTENFDYAFKDIRIKLPLLLFPLVFSSSKRLSIKEFRFIIGLFIAAVFTSTLISFYYLHFGGEIYRMDSRNISVFISHIRLALIICVAFFFGIYLMIELKNKAAQIVVGLLNAWLIYFLFILQSLTGLVVILLSIVIVSLWHFVKTKNRIPLVTTLTALLLVVLGVGIYLKSLYQDFGNSQATKDLAYEESSAYGELYNHADMNNPAPLRQNGYMVYKNIAWEELKQSWEDRSDYDLKGTTLKGDTIVNVLLWFLSSKGMKKDKEGVDALSEDEIKAIEMGIWNYNYMGKPGLEVRILKTFWEIKNYSEGGDFNGHSVVMRWEFWKTAVQIIKKHLLIGVGTGDVGTAFDQQYDQNKSILHANWRLRTHNQYLTLAVAFGLIGLSLCLYSFLLPFRIKPLSWIYLAFASVVLLSMLNEDTLETQVGVTLYAFFNSLLLFMLPEKEQRPDS